MHVHLILASSSPYRKTLLQRLGLPFSVLAPDIDETPQAAEAPEALARRLACAKAAVIAHDHPRALVIGSDQVASFNGQPIGKPGSREAARTQLRQFRDARVRFYTAVCVTDGKTQQLDCVTTDCHFLPLTDAQIEHYLAADRPWDTAGSARIEQLGIALMQAVQTSDPTALIGLPLIAVCRMLRSFGVDPLAAPEISRSTRP